MVINQSLPTVMIGIAIFLSPLFFLLCRKKHGRFRIRLKEAAIVAATWIASFLLIFGVYLFVVTPKKMVTAAEQDRNTEHASRVKAEIELGKANAELHAMTPGEQSEEIARLHATVKKFEDQATEQNAREWPPLSDREITEWATALAPFDVRLINVHWGQDVECKRLFRSLQAVGIKIGAKVQNWGGMADGDKIEITVDRNSTVGPTLLELFKRSNYPAEMEKSVSNAERGVNDNVGIFIPAKSVTQPSPTPDKEASPHGPTS